MGYRSDLTAGLGHGDEVYGLAPVVNDAQRRPVLPELTKKSLTRWGVGRWTLASPVIPLMGRGVGSVAFVDGPHWLVRGGGGGG